MVYGEELWEVFFEVLLVVYIKVFVGGLFCLVWLRRGGRGYRREGRVFLVIFWSGFCFMWDLDYGFEC